MLVSAALRFMSKETYIYMKRDLWNVKRDVFIHEKRPMTCQMRRTCVLSCQSSPTDSVLPASCQQKSWVTRESPQAFFVDLISNIRSVLYVSFQRIPFFDVSYIYHVGTGDWVMEQWCMSHLLHKCQHRPISIPKKTCKRDSHTSKETCIHQKRPIYIKRYLQKRHTTAYSRRDGSRNGH